MIAIRTVDGAVFRARTRTGLVRAMKRDQWNAPERKLPWMEEVSERVEQQTGKLVRCTSPDVFLDDLKAAGLVTFMD